MSFYPTTAEMEAAYAATGVFNEELRAGGNWVFAGGLHSPSTATVVDGTGEEPVTTDGPYSESEEQIGGFWVIEAPDLDAALDLAIALTANPAERAFLTHGRDALT